MWTLPFLRHAGQGWDLTLTPCKDVFDQRKWQQCQPRQALAYRFLAQCFYKAPDASWLSALREEGLFDSWPFRSKAEPVKAGLSALATYCAQWDPNRLKELEWDFNRLFVGPGEMLAPPWESVHLSKTKLTFQDSTLKVRQLYREFGWQAPAIHREPDDHLALELAFLAQVSDLAGCADERTGRTDVVRFLDAQRTILKDHLLQWAPSCLALVDTHAETDYYRGVARLTLGSLAESARLCGLPVESTYSQLHQDV